MVYGDATMVDRVRRDLAQTIRDAHAQKLYWPTDLGLSVSSCPTDDVHVLASLLETCSTNLAQLNTVAQIIATRAYGSNFVAMREVAGADGAISLRTWVCPFREPEMLVESNLTRAERDEMAAEGLRPNIVR